MSERYPMPQYEYKDVVKPERRPEILEIKEDRIFHLTDVVRKEWREFQETYLSEEDTSKEGWEEIFLAMTQYRDKAISEIETVSGEPPNRIEKDLIRAFWGIGKFYRQLRQRRGLNFTYEKENLTDTQRVRIEDNIDKLNIVSARWQNQVVNTLFALGENPAGREFLDFFWRTYEEIGDKAGADVEEIRSEKNGILGLAAGIEIFEKLGFEAYTAFAEQDAIKKVDFWTKKGNTILGIQNKSRWDSYILEGHRVRSYISTRGLNNAERKDAEASNTLLTSSREYDKMWQSRGIDCQVIPFWLNLPGPEAAYSQDPVTGKVTFPRDFSEREFAQKLAKEIGGS